MREQLNLSQCLPGVYKVAFSSQPLCLTGNCVFGLTHCTHATCSGQQGHSQGYGRDTPAGSAHRGQTLPIDASQEQVPDLHPHSKGKHGQGVGC